jgi:hypothetical protein
VTDRLIDKSALVRLGSSPDAHDWASRIERGLVRIATVTRLEVGYWRPWRWTQAVPVSMPGPSAQAWRPQVRL